MPPVISNVTVLIYLVIFENKNHKSQRINKHNKTQGAYFHCGPPSSHLNTLNQLQTTHKTKTRYRQHKRQQTKTAQSLI